LNGTHQLLAHSDDVNLLGDNIDTIKKNKEALIDANKEVGLEVNGEKTKYSYMLLSRQQNIGQIRAIKIANRSFESVSQFRYVGTTLKKLKINSGGYVCYHSVENLLFSRLLSKKRKN
jgi:hypothetical protein